MKINWFTVIAQVVNFLILVWLLKRYLYKPILNAVEEREKKIVAQLEDADAQKAEAQREHNEYDQKNQEFSQKKEALMNQVIVETNEERQKLIEEARNEAEALRDKLKKALETNQENKSLEISQKIQKEVFDIARKTLNDLASVSLEEQAVTVFIKRLTELKSEEKKRFLSAFNSGSSPILIRSAFDLPESSQNEIKKSVTEILGAKTQFQFEKKPDLISGVELVANGYKLSWSVSEHLKSLQKSFLESVNEKSNEGAKDTKH